jgi:hypothetical protein
MLTCKMAKLKTLSVFIVRPCMKTLDLQQAAALLHIHSVTLQAKARPD